MAAFFLDRSALVKRYANESGSKWTINLLRPSSGNIVYISRIACVEVVAALARKFKETSTGDKAIILFEKHSNRRYQQINISTDLISRAMKLARKHQLRGYDAIQLASALEVETERMSVRASSLIFVSADKELNKAAVSENLAVENPTAYL